MNETTVCVLGRDIEIDRSGVGHCWERADVLDCLPSTQEEIECEILDGGNDECDDYLASNGCHYRWSSTDVTAE